MPHSRVGRTIGTALVLLMGCICASDLHIDESLSCCIHKPPASLAHICTVDGGHQLVSCHDKRIQSPGALQARSAIARALSELLASTSLIRSARAIRIVRLDAPRTVQAGEPVKLRCLYDSKGDRLQSLSWYKNGREFYRFQPFERRQTVLIFNLTGVTIDLTKSGNHTVVLKNTSIETSGRYKCEATGSSFQEVNMETHVNVVKPVAKSSAGCHRRLTYAWLWTTMWSAMMLFAHIANMLQQNRQINHSI